MAPPALAPASPATAQDRWRVTLVAVLAVAQVVSAPLTPLLLGADASTGTVSDRYPSLLTPAGYAFTIWGVIYAACLALAVYQGLPAQRARAVHRRTGWWLALAFAASAVWVPIFGVGQLLVAQVVIVALVGALATALARLTALGPASDAAERWALRVPVSLYLGWATLATVASVGTTGRFLGLPAAGAVPTVAAMVAAVAATAVANRVIRGLAVLPFAAAAAWALAAIGVGTPSDYVRLVAIGCAVALTLDVATRLLRARRGERTAVAWG